MGQKSSILDRINCPSDLSNLTDEQLEFLAAEVREKIIEVTSQNGGHLASSLGAVDIILAAHATFNIVGNDESINASKDEGDKLLFDVGHQAYAHMLICDGVEKFETLRKFGGQTSFPRPKNSKFNFNVAGHASDSLSVAAGYAYANKLNGSNSKVVVIIGDAAIEGGMALEALNFIGAKQLPVVIILNDNAMAISKSVGAISRHLGNLRTNSGYRNAAKNVKKRLISVGEFGERTADIISRTKTSLKSLILPHASMFEKMGIMTTPPINGNNIKEVREMLCVVKNYDGPVIVHALTKKGKGYLPAERDPEKFHGVGKFDINTGKIEESNKRWTDVFGTELVDIAKESDNIVAITAAMEGGCGLKEFKDNFPDRFIDVGIAEENAVGVASGLAYAGKVPVVCIYSTFLQRAYDQMLEDVCLESKHVVFVIDRAGLVGEDGPTHHGLFDIAYLRTMPNMTILTPSDEEELKLALKFAIENKEGPVAIRYPKGEIEQDEEKKQEKIAFQKGKGRLLKNGEEVAILAFGRMTKVGLESAKALESEGVSTKVVDMRFAKPIDMDQVKECLSAKLIVTIEEGVLQGGAGEAISSIAAKEASKEKPQVLNFAIDNKFVSHGKNEELFTSCGLNAKNISEQVLKSLRATCA